MITFVVSAALSAFFRHVPDIVVVETDPPLLCLLGFCLKKLRRVRLVIYLQDIYPDVAELLNQLPGWFPTKLVRRLFYYVYRCADTLVVLSEDMKKALVDAKVDPDRICVIPNWVDTDRVYPIPRHENVFRRRHSLGNRFLVMYSGNIGLSQRLEDVVEVANVLRDNDDILFAIVGDGANRQKLEQLVRDKRLNNVRFFDYQPKDILAHSLSAADIQLVLLAPKLERCLMPSKLYSAMAAGQMILAITDSTSDLAHLVEEEEVGIVCSNGDVKAIANSISRVVLDPELCRIVGMRSRQLVVERFDRRSIVNRFALLLSPDLDDCTRVTERLNKAPSGYDCSNKLLN